MFGRIEIVYDHRDDALTVPRSAIVEEDGETAVFVVDKTVTATAVATTTKEASGATQTKVSTAPPTESFTAHRKLVKLGYSDGDKVEIRSGIDEGSRVITVGRNAVRDGTSVQVLNNSANLEKEKAVAAAKLAGAQG